jgi:hypothetical protein
MEGMIRVSAIRADQGSASWALGFWAVAVAEKPFYLTF